MPAVARHKTALHRVDLSRPVRLALEDGLLNPATDFFDFGCGRGSDVRLVSSRGIASSGWDPTHRPTAEKRHADIVNIGYVVNVIESAQERAEAMRSAWSLTRKVLVVSARLTFDEDFTRFQRFEDGCLTRTGTFQKFYEQDELRAFIDDTLNTASVAAAPGVFYAFKDDNLRQTFAAARYRRRVAVPRQSNSEALFEEHKGALTPLLEFLASRGRLPDERELELGTLLAVFGSIKRAFSVIKRVTSPDAWELIADQRSEDLLVYLALQRFARRPAFAQLPLATQLDVKAFFRSYNRACALADILLFSAGDAVGVDGACRATTVGKLTGNALYVHESALSSLAPVLRVYEGCARAFIGAVEGANLVKLHRGKPQISYLAYPNFESDPHPALAASLVVPLQTFKPEWRSYAESDNPPILHRKEEFVAADYPNREKFANLTSQEEKRGLYSRPEIIGTKSGWNSELARCGVEIRGHQLRKHRKDSS